MFKKPTKVGNVKTSGKKDHTPKRTPVSSAPKSRSHRKPQQIGKINTRMVRNKRTSPRRVGRIRHPRN